jgi:transposase-like protein
MAMVEVKCPQCGDNRISKNGRTAKGVQKYLCNNRECKGGSFLLEYTYNGCKPGVDEQIIAMTANASGIRDISRVLKVSKQKVSDTLKKQRTQ